MLASCRTRTKFPSVFDAASKTVSVIVPAYNEEARIVPMMTDMLAHLEDCAKKDKCVLPGGETGQGCWAGSCGLLIVRLAVRCS